MSQFLRLLNEDNKADCLQLICANFRQGKSDSRIYEAQAEDFNVIPGRPFAYWVSQAVRDLFVKFDSFEATGGSAWIGASTKDDFRFLRLFWEPSDVRDWRGFGKGGEYSKFYGEPHLLINWRDEGAEIAALVVARYPYLNGNADWVLHRECPYGTPALTWTRRTTKGLSVRTLPAECMFSDKGPAASVVKNSTEELLATMALLNSRPFQALVELQLAAGDAAARSYEVGLIKATPFPICSEVIKRRLAKLAKDSWKLARIKAEVDETSHAFLLPASLNNRVYDFEQTNIELALNGMQADIDDIAFELYGFSEEDRLVVQPSEFVPNESDVEAYADNEADEEGSTSLIDEDDGLLSWAVGVVFGRFDWRLATGERKPPTKSEPFDALPDKSPGMLPSDAEPFHSHAGVLVDDQGHAYDLGRLIEEVLAVVGVTVPEDVRSWLQRAFFVLHLQYYSKSRRKAPIYWPLSTTSASYTLWVYYPNLTSQTLYIAINDFVEPKLTQVGADLVALRNKLSNRTRDDEKQFETLQAFELELIELRDTLLTLAPNYKPNHDDGVQISAAPLWPLFRHKPWQKVLKDTWAKLEKGDYDWANLAMNYWPDRVREKCKTDKSLAIAHGLEHLYIEPEAQPKKARGRKKAGGDE